MYLHPRRSSGVSIFSSSTIYDSERGSSCRCLCRLIVVSLNSCNDSRFRAMFCLSMIWEASISKVEEACRRDMD